MATKSASPTETIIATVTDLMEESRKFKENIEIQKQAKEYEASKALLSANTLHVPPIMMKSMAMEPIKDSVLLEGAMQRNPKLGISRSQDDEQQQDEKEEATFGRVTPIPYAVANVGPTPAIPIARSGLSSVGASRASNFRMKFRKSHTCGSLFAKCNCAEVPTDRVPNTVSPLPTNAAVVTGHASSSRAISIDKSLNIAASATTTTTATIHNYHHHQQQQQQCMHLSISPSSNTESSLASSISDTAGTRLTSSGIYSLSTQTSSATSAYLSREESLTASFDTQLLSPTSEVCGESAKSSVTAIAPANSSALAKPPVSSDIELASFARSKPQPIPRISSPPTVGIESPTAALKSSPQIVARRSESIQKSKKLFQTYSHPDTDFVFTDENKHPSRESLQHLLSPQQQSQDTVITARGGRVEIKQPKRSSSPNIGQYHILDVAVHPDILVKISPKHSPICEARRPHESPLASRSTQQRRRLLQRSHEIDSGGSTSESEKSVDVKSPTTLKSPLLSSCPVAVKPLTPPSASPLLPSKRLPGQSSSSAASDESTFNAAQKYFAESGILGPVPNTASNLIRKTSKILQDTHVIEQVS